MSTKQTFVVFDSDRVDLIDSAVEMFCAVQERLKPDGYSPTTDLLPCEQQAYAAACKYLVKEFNKGATEISRHVKEVCEDGNSDDDDEAE